MTSRHFCCIVFIRSQSHGPAHTWGEELLQGLKYQEVRVFEVILEAACHTRALFLPLRAPQPNILKLEAFSGVARGTALPGDKSGPRIESCLTAP